MKGQLGKLEVLLKALADATRLRILGLLTTGEVCVCHIHESLKISQPKASRHLAYLRRAGLVTTRREGLWVHYKLAPALDPLVVTIQEAVIHVLGHVDAVRNDAQRLRRLTGAYLPNASGEGAYACCQAANVSVTSSAARLTS